MNVRTVVVAILIAAGGIVADRFLLWCEARGWIYWRRTKRRPGLGTSPLIDLLSVYHPAQRHVIEHRLEAEDQQDGESKDGGRPDPE